MIRRLYAWICGRHAEWWVSVYGDGPVCECDCEVMGGDEDCICTVPVLGGCGPVYRAPFTGTPYDPGSEED